MADEEVMYCDEGYVLKDGECLDESEPIYISFDETLTYNVNLYSFIGTSRQDILYNTYDLQEDYILVSTKALNIVYNDFEAVEYGLVLDSVSELATYSNSSIEYVVDLQTSELTELASDASISLTPQNIFTLNSLKLRQDELVEKTNGFYQLSKSAYLEARLDISLTNQNIINFERLQYLFSDIHYQYGEVFYIKDNTFEEFLIHLEELYSEEDILSYQDLEDEYNLLKSLQ